MRTKRITVLLLALAIIITFSLFGIPVYADDVNEYSEFEVSEEAYNTQYRDNPDYELTGTVTYYRYGSRYKITTTSGYDTLSGYVKYDTKTSTSTSGYKFGTPVSTSTSYANGRKTVTSATDTGWYYYAYTVANPSKTSDWAYYAATSRDNVISYMKARFNSSSYAEGRLRYYWKIYGSDQGEKSANVGANIAHCEDSTVSKGTTVNDGNAYYGLKLYRYSQCYKVKTVTTTNYFYQWSDWSNWTAWNTGRQTITDSETQKEETQTRYLVRQVKELIPITDCELNVNGPTEFAYDGEPKQLELSLTYNGEVLENGTDYFVEGGTSTDAGQYTAKISGLKDFGGELTVDYVINKADSVIDFADDTVIRSLGTEDFTIYPMIHETDGNIEFSSSNPDVATVGPDGTVSIVGKGSTVITASAAEGNNYLPGQGSYNLIIAQDIADSSTVTIALTTPSSFTYDGNEKHIGFDISTEEQTLVEGKDYSVRGNYGTDVGRYEVVIAGIGEYAGEVSEILTITKAAPELSFASSAMTKRLDSQPFVNQLTAVTDGTITYSSGNEKVATVDGNGRVTPEGVGTTTITATASEGKNYKAGKATYSLVVTEKAKVLTYSDLSYSFINSRTGLGYSEEYVIPADIYRTMFGKTVGGTLYMQKKNKKWGGNCAGFSGSSALLFDETNGIYASSFNAAANAISELKVRDETNNKLVLQDFIECMQVAQYASLFQETDKSYRINEYYLKSKKKTLNNLFDTIRDQTEAGIPVVVTLRQETNGLSQGHAVLAYRADEEAGKIYIYDSNHPLKECAISLEKDGEGNWTDWYYDLFTDTRWGSVCGTGTSQIGLVPYGIIQELWENRGNLQKNNNLIATNARSLEIFDVEDNLIATVEDGTLTEAGKGVVQYACDLSLEPDNNDVTIISMPIDIYRVRNNDNSVSSFELDMVNSDVGSSVQTSANEVTVVADDEYGLNQVYIEASQDDTYSVTLNSSADNDNKEVKVSGRGSDEMLEISQNEGQVNVENCQVLSMSVDDKELNTHKIKARAFGHGAISPAGESEVITGTDRIYTITPEPGYEIEDVIIDDQSVGVVDTYTFKNVTGNHEIIATFEANQNTERISNTIYAKDLAVNSAARTQYIKLNASSDSSAGLLYQSNNSMITVNSDGTVTIPANYIGSAVITITAPANDVFEQTSRKVKVSIRPMNASKFKAKAQKGRKLKTTWKKRKGVTGYEVQYSLKSSFANAKIKQVKGWKKTNLTIKKLKARKTYYVRIRSYVRNASGVTYSDWSGTKKVKIKK